MAWELTLVYSMAIIVVVLLFLTDYLNKLNDFLGLVGIIITLYILLTIIPINKQILVQNGINITGANLSGTFIVSILDTNYEILIWIIYSLLVLLFIGLFIKIIKGLWESRKGTKGNKI